MSQIDWESSKPTDTNGRYVVSIVLEFNTPDVEDDLEDFTLALIDFVDNIPARLKAETAAGWVTPAVPKDAT